MEFLSKLFFENIWECYYRKIKNDSFIDRQEIKYDWRKIKVPRRYWCADPFIVSDKGKNYVFCELMDRKISRGLLGIGEISEDKEVKIRILKDLGCHTSYPDVFKVSGMWYMIPETVDRKSIELYKAISFPYEWEKVADLIQEVNAVDTTTFCFNDKVFVFVYEENKTKNILSIAELDLNKLNLKNKQIVMEYKAKIGRPGGKILYRNGRMFRPTQYGVNHYGESLIVKEFLYNGKNFSYTEKDAFKIQSKDIFPEKITNNLIGLHTYNSSDEYEIVDVLKKKFFIERPIVALLKKAKIGGYKYYVRKR